MSKNVKDKLLKELVDNQINYEIEGEGEKEVIILDKDSMDKSFAIPQLKALILDCLGNSREYGVKLMLLAGTENETPVDQLEMMFELKEGKIDSSKSLKNLSKDRSLKYLSSDSEELNRADRYEELLKKFDIDYERVNNTFLLNEKIVDEVPRLEGVEIIPNSEESSIYITKETIVNDQKKFNEIEKRTKEKYNMGKDNEVLFENIESYYLSGHESYLKEVIDIATRNDLFVEVSSTGTSLNINHEGSTLLNLVLDGELSQEIKNKIDEATSLLVKENSRILSELTGGSVDSYEPTIEDYEEALKQADSLYEESQDYVNDYALPQKSDEKEREVKSIDFFTDENSESARVNEKSMKLEDDLNLKGKDPLRYIMEHSQNKKEAIEEIDKYCDDQKKLILEGQLTKQLVEDGIDYEIKDGIVILKDLDKIPNNPKLAYDVIEGLEAGRVLILDEDADYRDGSKILDRIKEVAKKFNEEVDELLKIHSTGDNFKKSNFNSKEIGENAYQMELTSKGFRVVNDTPFEYMRKILSNRKVTFYTKKDNTYFLETKEGLLERTEQSLHEDIANCKFDVLIFKDGFKETKGKEDSVSLGDSRFIELLEAINEPKDLNTILNLGEQLEFNIARFDGVVDFSSYAEVVLSFCIGDRGFECNTTVDRETRKAETVRDVLTKRGRANGFHMLLTSEEPTSQQKTKAVCLDKNSNVLNGLSAEQIAYKVYVEDDVENLKEFNGDAVDYKGDKFKTLRMENKQTYESIFINRNNPRVQAIIDRIEENPNWDEILRLCHVNHYSVAQVHDDVIIQDKEGNTILKFKDSKIKGTPKQLTAPSDVKETIRTKRCTITTVESLQNCLDSLVNKDVDISLTYSIYCHLQDLINAKGKLEVSYEDISNLSDEDALKYWDKWRKNNPRKTHNEVIPIFEDLATEAVQLNIFINSLFWEALAFKKNLNQEVDSEVEQAIETAIKEVSEKFNLTLGRFMKFQYETGRNVAKKRVKELQSKIKIEEDIEKKEELTKALNNEYSVLEQAEVSIEEVDNAEACNISYFIETKVYRMIGKYKYLQWKDYIEYRAKQGAESIVLDKKNIVDDMTKYLTMSNRAMRPVRTMTFVYNKEAMKNFSKEEKLDILNRILNKPTIPYFASEILPKNKVLERICIGTRTGKVQSLPFDIYLYCEGNDLMLNYLDENLNLSGINYEAFECILNSDLTVACLDQKAYDKIRGYCNRKDKDSSRVYNLDEYMKRVYGGFTVSGAFSLVTEDKQIEFYQLNKLPGVTTKIQ